VAVGRDVLGPRLTARLVAADGRDLGPLLAVRIDERTSQWKVLHPLADGPAGARVVPDRARGE
jgi:hypothetical protein